MRSALSSSSAQPRNVQYVIRQCRRFSGNPRVVRSANYDSIFQERSVSSLSGHGQRSIASAPFQYRRAFSGKSVIEADDTLTTLAIETSCDDTSVAILSISRQNPGDAEDDINLQTKVIFHEKITSRSDAFQGIHPIVALESHQKELGPLVQKAIQAFRDHSESEESENLSPDFVTVTRGPGMRSNLAVGLDVAKGLATAWDVPLVGVHHMQAHALTSRLCYTLEDSRDGAVLHEAHRRPDLRRFWKPEDLEPKFPFLSVLVSGGHTMLIDSKGLTKHAVLAETADIAVGDFLDKAARAVLPSSELKVPYGKALEDFAFPRNAIFKSESYEYEPPERRQDEMQSRVTDWGWALAPPLAESKGGDKSSRRMMYSFAGLLTAIERLAACEMDFEERQELAREVQRVAFEHLASRILLYLTSEAKTPATIVVSGGVASNGFLRHILRSILDVRGYEDVELRFPPVELCTDNALMIAWAGMEMYDAGCESKLSIAPLRKWSMDPRAADGGIVGVGGWKSSPVEEEEAEKEEAGEGVSDEQKIASDIELNNTPPEWTAAFWWVMVGLGTLSYFTWGKHVPITITVKNDVPTHGDSRAQELHRFVEHRKRDQAALERSEESRRREG